MYKNLNALLVFRNLKTCFYTEDGVVKAVDGIDLNVYPGFRKVKLPGVVGDVQGILRLHLVSICCHGRGKPESNRTWVSVIYELSKDPVLYPAAGNLYENEYQRFGFE